MERWLSLTVLDPVPPKSRRVHISVPKRTVKLAVARNRIKRVLREAVRRDVFFERDGIYRLRVHEFPRKLNLALAQKVLEALHD